MDAGMKAGVLGQGAQKDREACLLAMASTQVKDKKGLATGEADANKQKTGDALVKFGVAYASYGQYDKAIEDIQAGIAKGVESADDANRGLASPASGGAGKRAQGLEAFKGIAAGTRSAQISPALPGIRQEGLGHFISRPKCWLRFPQPAFVFRRNHDQRLLSRTVSD